MMTLATPAISTEPYMLAVLALGVTGPKVEGPFVCAAPLLGRG